MCKLLGTWLKLRSSKAKVAYYRPAHSSMNHQNSSDTPPAPAIQTIRQVTLNSPIMESQEKLSRITIFYYKEIM